MSDFVVVDASVAFKWLVEEEHSDKATALARIWDDAGTRLAAPHLMPFEVTNILHRRVVRGELTVEVAVSLIRDLISVGIELHESPDLHAKALELASRLMQGATYDALPDLGRGPQLRAVDRRREVGPRGETSSHKCAVDR